MYPKKSDLISWADVQALVKQIERDYGVSFTSTIECGASAPNKACIRVCVTLRHRTRAGKGKVVAKVQNYFPQRRWNSITGCLVGSLYEAIEHMSPLPPQAKC